MAGSSIKPGWALVIVDMQNDFMHPGGSMTMLGEAGEAGEAARAACIAEVRQPANIAGWDLVVFTRDKHPAEVQEGNVLKPGHVSFASSSYHSAKKPDDRKKYQDADDFVDKTYSVRYKVVEKKKENDTGDTKNEPKIIDGKDLEASEKYEKCALDSATYSFVLSKLQPGCGVSEAKETTWRVEKQELWPDHCVMQRWGSDVVDELRDLAPAFRQGDGAAGQGLLYSAYIEATAFERGTLSLPAGGARYKSLFFDKGMDRRYDAYSAVFENVEAVVQQGADQVKKREVRNCNPWSLVSYKCTLTEILRAQGIKNVCVVGVAADFCVKETARGLVEQKFKVCVVKAATLAIDSKFNFEQQQLTARAHTLEFCKEAWMQDSYVSSVWDSTSRAARKLYSQISFRLQEGTVQLLIDRAEKAQAELKTKLGLEPKNVSSDVGFWLSKMANGGNYWQTLVREDDSKWGPMYTCLSSECRAPIPNEKLGDNRRPRFARVLDQDTPKTAVTASEYSQGLTSEKSRAQSIAAVADLAMPFTSSMGPNVILLFEKTDGSDDEYQYGKTRINVFDTGDTGGKAANTVVETARRAHALLTAKTGFVDRYALAMLDLVLKNMETYLFDFTHVYKKGTAPEVVGAEDEAKRQGYIAQMRQGVGSEYWLSLTARKLSAPEVKLPFADCRDYFVVYDGLRKVYKDACSFYSSRRSSQGGEISQLTALKAFGWDWQLYFQTYVDSRQSEKDGAKGPQFSICSPHAQSFLYPVQGSCAQTDEEFLNAYERVVDRMADWFAKDYGSQEAVKPKAFVDAHACLHMCNQLLLAKQENKASPAPVRVNTNEPPAAKAPKTRVTKKKNFSPPNDAFFSRFESNSFSSNNQ